MRAFNPRSFVLSITIVILFASTGCISSVSALQQQQTPLGVRITDPARGQQLAIGKNLTIAGTSSYSSSSNCGVYVIVDGIKPYQKTTPIGQVGGNDYAKWKYTLAPAYVGTIKEGVNRITAKLVCQASPVNLTKFYSINVTGMNEGIPSKQPSVVASNNTAPVPVSSNSMSYLYHLAPLLPAGHDHSVSTSTSSSISSESSGGSGHHHSVSGKHHGKSGSSKHHGPSGPGGFFNGGPSGPGGFFNGGPSGPGGFFNGGPSGPGGFFNGGPSGPGSDFNGGYDSDNPFGTGY